MDILAATSAGIVVKSRTLPGETEVRLVRRGGAQTVVARLNAHLRGVDLAKVVELRHAAPDGTPVKSWLYLPPDPGPSPPLPLVVIPYAGAVYLRPPSQMAGDVLNLTPNAQVLAGQGYAVLVPSLPRAKTTGEPAEGLGLQIEQAIDSALATGRIDPERIAVWGHSFGGYTALVMATQSVRIRSVIVSAGISDLTGVWAGFSAQQAATPEPGQALVGAGWAENGQAGLGLPPWRTPDRYVRNSPLYKADQVHAPILLLHGDLDSVPLGQAQAMFTALQRQGKDAVLVTYAGEGHVISSPGNLRDMYAKVLDWLAATLPPPRQGQTPAGRPAPPTSAAKLRWRPRQGNRRIRHAR
jgi:dipeptidyl aminopeptidase/acylaminoacyl peptidase